ncbi:hypothetical protein U0N67_003951 [Vibrio parahaemolyticus]|uniref:hypothetical protein n=1 Tax=Vibrio diabolicus subgroup TaxID=2315253 RepID=UPI0026589D2D|nr:hypothetical protein [Vibrio antiquarius]EIO3707130.1 hypothetical protein [Vibrio parahaemolyticus]ELZ7200077.1 hypothetical protein [Vibrio parahaemolyticus]MCR9582237.1 hypothetical protein [Vibrio antiquarius]MCR9616699.1 hypothetical protein [Vibrio antiquarius]HCG8042798.1 hypothetical protein [Vibrio parahaemolyticus]
MTVRFREPFFSIYNELESDERFTLSDFIARTKEKDKGYENLNEKELRKIVYRQIVRLKKQKLILQLSPKRDSNPHFVTIKRGNPDVSPLIGCRISPLSGTNQEKKATSSQFLQMFNHVQAQIRNLQTKKIELTGEAEGYAMLRQSFPEIKGVIEEQARKVNTETAKLNGMLNAFNVTMKTLRAKSRN